MRKNIVRFSVAFIYLVFLLWACEIAPHFKFIIAFIGGIHGRELVEYISKELS